MMPAQLEPYIHFTDSATMIIDTVLCLRCGYCVQFRRDEMVLLSLAKILKGEEEEGGGGGYDGGKRPLMI